MYSVKILNSFFVAQTMVVGMDGFIVNPTDKLMMGTVAAGNHVAAQSLKGGTDSYIWEPNYDTHTNSGIIAAENFYNIVGLQNEGSSIQKYEGVKAEFTGIPLTEASSKVSGQENFFAEVPIDLATKADNKDLVDTGIYLSAGVTKVRVYFWVEGQDVDAENDATGSDMNLNLEFSIN